MKGSLHSRRRPLHEAEAADRISLHLARRILKLIDKALPEAAAYSVTPAKAGA